MTLKKHKNMKNHSHDRFPKRMTRKMVMGENNKKIIEFGID